MLRNFIFGLFVIVAFAEQPLAQTQKMLRHSTNAQCWSTDSPSLNRASGSLLRSELSDSILVNNSFRVWFLAQLMPRDGYKITFHSDHSIESEPLKMVTRWEISGTKLLLLDIEGRLWFRFKYSDGCGTIVHEYEYASTPQVMEIGIVQ